MKPKKSLGVSSRWIGKRATPSLSCGAMASNAAAARSPPVRLSVTMPTSWPRSAWPPARSRICRKMPPTGARVTCTILSALPPIMMATDGRQLAQAISRQQGRDAGACES
jgi:hypothetical protein